MKKQEQAPVLTAGVLPESRSDISRIWLILAASGAALLLPRAPLYGSLTPFGVAAAAAATGIGAPIVYVAALAGYVCFFGVSAALRYVAAVVAVAGLHWAISGITAKDKPWVPPVLAAVSLWLSGGITLALSHAASVYTVLLTVCEGVAAGAFACLCHNALTAVRQGGIATTGQLASVSVVGALLLAAVADLSVGGISPGRAAAVLPVLLLARFERETGGAVAGVIMGTALALAQPDKLWLCGVYAFGGLAAGLLSRFGRGAGAVAFLAAAALWCPGTADMLTALSLLYEAAAGALLFLLMPPRWERALRDFCTRHRDTPAVESFRRAVSLRLDCASRAMQEVAHTVDTVSEKLTTLSAPDLSGIYRRAADTVCRDCGLKLFCWNNQFGNTMDSFNHLTPLLRERGTVAPEDMQGHLARHCGRLTLLTRQINDLYKTHRMQEGAFRRLQEIRMVLTEQFAGVGDILAELSDSLATDRRMDADTASRARIVCEECGIPVRDAVCFLDKRQRMTLELLTEESGERVRKQEWLEALCDACDRELAPPVITELGEYRRLTLREKPRYRPVIGLAQHACTGETLCGDAVEQFTDDSGRFVAVLSDGMGSGGRAAVDGAMAAGLTARLMQAGFGDDSVLKLVNAALMVKSGDESLATLDVLRVDLYSGWAESLKAGAAASLLLSKGRVSRWEQAALPVGILRDVAFERQQDTLVPGDVVLVVSDGVYADGTAWLETLLREEGGRLTMPQLAQKVVEEACRRRQHEDDVTALALLLS